MITNDQLRSMFPNAGARLNLHLPFIDLALTEGRINTPHRIAAFLAQAAHESGEYRYMEEIASGEAYEGRADLGNTQPGDGVKFKGRCPFQITGRNNYSACGKALGLDLIADPTLIAKPEHGTRAAVWFWNKGSNASMSLLADQDWFRVITRWINGGYNGWAERLAYYERNRSLLGLLPYDPDAELGSIKAFQTVHGLQADGAVGKMTIRALA